MRIDLQQQFERMVQRRRLESSREDAASQLAIVREMLERTDARDVAAMGTVALAMENCAETVKHHLALCLGCV
jgi:hypothetical protein